jgi:hypothetical protein
MLTFLEVREITQRVAPGSYVGLGTTGRFSGSHVLAPVDGGEGFLEDMEQPVMINASYIRSIQRDRSDEFCTLHMSDYTMRVRNRYEDFFLLLPSIIVSAKGD